MKRIIFHYAFLFFLFAIPTSGIAMEQEDKHIAKKPRLELNQQETDVELQSDSSTGDDFNKAPLNAQLFMIHNIINRLSDRMNQGFESLKIRLKHIEDKIEILERLKKQSIPSNQRNQIVQGSILQSTVQQPLPISISTPVIHSVDTRQDQQQQQPTQSNQVTTGIIETAINPTALPENISVTKQETGRAPRNLLVKTDKEIVLRKTADNKQEIYMFDAENGNLLRTFILPDHEWLTFHFNANNNQLIGIHTYGVMVFHNMISNQNIIAAPIFFLTEKIIDASIYQNEDNVIYIAFLREHQPISIWLLQPGEEAKSTVLNKIIHTIDSSIFKFYIPQCLYLTADKLIVGGSETENHAHPDFYSGTFIFSFDWINKPLVIKTIAHKHHTRILTSEIQMDNIEFWRNDLLLQINKPSLYEQQKSNKVVTEWLGNTYTIYIDNKKRLNFTIQSKQDTTQISKQARKLADCKCVFIVDNMILAIRHWTQNGVIELYNLPKPNFETKKTTLGQWVVQKRLNKKRFDWAFPISDGSKVVYITEHGNIGICTLKK